MSTHVIGDTGVLTGRSLRHIVRSPDTIITTAVTPIALMLLFVYVFSGAIDTGGAKGSYIDYMLPGILLITIASGIAYTAYRLFLDLQGGIFERFQSMPIARSSVLWGHVLTSLVANLVKHACGSGPDGLGPRMTRFAPEGSSNRSHFSTPARHSSTDSGGVAPESKRVMANSALDAITMSGCISTTWSTMSP